MTRPVAARLPSPKAAIACPRPHKTYLGSTRDWTHIHWAWLSRANARGCGESKYQKMGLISRTSAERFFSLPTVLGAWIAFGLAHTLARIEQPSPLGEVDGLSMMAAQSLALAYEAGQPPFYDWALWAVQQFAGPTAFSSFFTKYAFSTAAGGFIYCGTFAASGDRRLATIASLSLMLLFHVGMLIHDQSTHSVALIAALAATFYCYAMIAKRGAWRDYVGLGIAIAAGTLSKFGFLIMPVSFALAFLYSPSLRPRILSPRFGVALVITAAITLPFLSWLVLHLDDLAVEFNKSLIVQAQASYPKRVLSGLAQLFGSLVAYSLPIMPVLWILYPRLLTRGVTLQRARAGLFPDVLGLALALGMLIAIALILASGIDIMPPRYMHVLALLVPVYAVLYLRPEELSGRRLTTFLAIVVVAQMATFAQRALFAPLFPGPPFCKSCGFLKPTDQLAAELTARGLARATIWVERDEILGGNLRHYMPAAQIRTRHLWALALPARKNGEPCVMIVEAIQQPGAPFAITFPPAPPGFVVPPDLPQPIKVPSAKRSTTWIVQRLRADDPRCRDQEW